MEKEKLKYKWNRIWKNDLGKNDPGIEYHLWQKKDQKKYFKGK